MLKLAVNALKGGACARKAAAKIGLVLAAFFLLSTTAFASPTLSSGSHGHDVLVLQKRLAAIGYALKSIDGIYGSETERVVAAFQRDNKIRVTGIVNNATWRALQTAKTRPRASTAKAPAKAPAKKTPAGKVPTKKAPAKSVPLAPNGRQILPRAKANAIVATAKRYIGTPYKFGGATPKAFDCSGFLQYVFRQNGLMIPRTADEQYKLGIRTKTQKELFPGDLVFFHTYEPGPSHCGIYVGSGNFIHASSSKGVRIDSLSNSYWAPRYLGGKHIVK